MSLETQESRREMYEKINGVAIQTAILTTKVEGFESDFESIDQKLDDINMNLVKLNETINGNGKPGLKERLGVLETRILGISSHAEIQDGQEFQKYMSIRSAIIALIFAAFSFIAGALFEYIKGVF